MTAARCSGTTQEVTGMSSGLVARATSASFVRRLTPWAVVLLVGALLMSILPTAQAQSGSSAAEAIPIGNDGRFAGTDGFSQSLWYKFNYVGGNQTATITVTFEPTDANRLDIFIWTGDPSSPHKEAAASTVANNVRTIQFTDAGSTRIVFLEVKNDYSDRTVSFVGAITPASTIATPTATPQNATVTLTPQTTPPPGPVAPNAASAITLVDSGQFSGTLGTRQGV